MKKFERQPIEVLVLGVREYCRDNYENGWADLVIETMEDADVIDVIKSAKAHTVRTAIIAMRRRWGAYAEQRRAVRNEAF